MNSGHTRPRPVLGIGWDVGGWMGRKQGVAAVRFTEQDGLHWLGRPNSFQLPADGLLTPERLLGFAGVGADALDGHDIVVAIDAPLGFPASFARLVSGWPYGADDHADERGRPDREIDSKLAYRETDRHVHERIRIVRDGVVTGEAKKPLSAPFDKLGNNATVAISHVRLWRKDYGFVAPPMDALEDATDRSVIEVYPALVKERRAGVKGARALPWFKELMRGVPDGVEEPSDDFDAAICAVLAACYGADGAGLPSLVAPGAVMDPAGLETIRREGWIYYLPPR